MTSVWELYTQLFARNWRCRRFAQSLSQGCSEKIRKKDNVITAGRWLSWSTQIPQFLMLWWPDESWIYCYDPETEFPVEACWLSQTQEGQTKQIHPQTFNDPFFWQHWHDLHALGSNWTDSQQGILCWGFKGVQEEIPSERASTLQIGSVAFPPGQCTSPQLHPCHRLFDQDGHQDSCSPSLKSRPCSLWLKEKLRGCRYETIEEMKEAMTKVIDMLTQEDFQKLLEWYNKCIAARGDYFEGD